MKRIITLIIVASFIFTLAACGNGGAQTNPSQTGTGGGASVSAEPAMSREINIGYDGGLCQGVIAIAQEKGFFAAEGLTNTKLVKSENARDAMAGGKLDTSAGMIAVWLKPISNGIDITFTVGLHTGCTSAVVLADSDIEAFSDVVGKTIAITSGIGGQNQNIAFRFLAHDGLRDSDFKWADFPADQGLVVLERGDAAVFVGPDQIIERWVQEGSVRRIRSLTFDEDFINEACCVMGISGDFIRDNPTSLPRCGRVYSNRSTLRARCSRTTRFNCQATAESLSNPDPVSYSAA